MESRQQKSKVWLIVALAVVLIAVGVVSKFSRQTLPIIGAADAGMAALTFDAGSLAATLVRSDSSESVSDVGPDVPDEQSDSQPDNSGPLPDCGNGIVDKGEMCDPNVEWPSTCPGGFGLCWVCSFDCHHKQLMAGTVLFTPERGWYSEPFCSRKTSDGQTTQVWGQKGLLTSVQSPNLDYQFTYDSSGHLTTGVMRHGRKLPARATYTWDSKGNMIGSVTVALDDAGVATEINRMEWDSLGRSLHELTPGKSEWVYEYDDLKNISRGRFDKNGDGVFDEEYRATFDDAGTRIHQWVDSTGDGVPETDFAYGHNDAGAFEDLNGNGIRDEGEDSAEAEPAPHTDVVIDLNGLVLSRRINSEPPECTRYSYNEQGLLQSIEEQQDCNDEGTVKMTTYKYDKLGVMTSEVVGREKTVRDTACFSEFAAEVPWAAFKEVRISDADRKSGTSGIPEPPR